MWWQYTLSPSIGAFRAGAKDFIEGFASKRTKRKATVKRLVTTNGVEMHRRDILLAIMASGNGRSFTPAQIQKATFLVSRNLPDLFTESAFGFVPYDYGPFDIGVYNEAEKLQSFGLAEITPNGRWKLYGPTPEGLTLGRQRLSEMAPEFRAYVEGVASWVLRLDFGSLVKAIYEEYPEMREKSIFRG